MAYVLHNDVRVHYRVAGPAKGDGAPSMVLIHANPFDHTLWLYQIARFSTWFRVIAVDIRSYGRTDKIEEPFTLEDMCDDVMAVIDEEEADHAVLMGASVGSKMALMLALDHPDAFSALVLVGGSAGRQPGHFDRRIKGYRTGGAAAYHREHLESLVAPGFPKTRLGDYLLRTQTEKDEALSGAAIARGFEALAAAGVEERLSAMKPPVLVVNGEFDTALPRGKATAAMIPGARHVLLKGAGHACNTEDPAAFDAAVIAFLKEKGLMPSL
ncbi:MAG TPA: alpha/beta fold hydrolase [Alphaproteobacteria bacterium]|nr:alpha/beta fold hydrolase [Alphaproteobacteria bacterium]